MQKALEDANVKLGNVLSDVFGVSGQLTLDALLEGKARPEEIAQFAKRSAKKKIPGIIQALEGHRMSDHHRKMIRYSLKHLEFLEEQIGEMDRDIATQISDSGLDRQWQLLQTVPGIQDRSAAAILAETGAEMEQFPSRKHLSCWAGVCPGNNRSAGKNKSSHTTGGNPWLRCALTECAWAAKKNCFIKEKFWRITSKSGGKKAPAVVAVAHTLLELVYEVLRTQQPFQDRQAPPLDDRQRQRMIRHHIRRLGKLGISVPRYAVSVPPEEKDDPRLPTGAPERLTPQVIEKWRPQIVFSEEPKPPSPRHRIYTHEPKPRSPGRPRLRRILTF